MSHGVHRPVGRASVLDHVISDQPHGLLGALQLQQETSPLPNSAISYAYDALGRLASRSVAGAGAESFGYDAIGRLISDASDLGAFALSYLGQTNQIAARQLANATLETTWSYLPNAGDRRLAGIDNTGLSSGQYSNYTYTSTPENLITAIAETSDSGAVYPSPGQQTASYNNLNQLTNLSGQALTFDADGNLLSDGQRTYSWDAENRLVGITYPGQPGKATAFAYDGLSRRTAISSTPAGGGSAVTTSYIWCGARRCQARNAIGAVTREYFNEGEYLPGSPAQPYYYGSDQIGSVRRVFVSASSAPAYSYDPYGNALQATAPLTDFNYAGMFYNSDSGLYLTQFRIYDPVASRWLSRDPLGEGGDPAANLYAYVQGNPVSYVDRLGLDGWSYGPPPPGIPGGPYVPQPGQRSGTFMGPKPPQGGTRSMCRGVPPTGEGGPPGTPAPYWKYTPAGGGAVQKYNMNGELLPPGDEGHAQDDLKGGGQSEAAPPEPASPEPASPAPEPTAPEVPEIELPPMLDIP